MERIERRKNILSRISISEGDRFETEFEILSMMGRGSYGEVYMATNICDQGKYAVKKIQMNERDIEAAMGEVQILAKLKHHSIVRYFGAWIERSCPKHADTPSTDFGGKKGSSFSDDDSFSVVFGDSNTTSPEDGTESESSLSVESRKYFDNHVAASPVFLYLQMELCLPKTLKDWMQEHKMSPLVAADCFQQITDAVSYIHSQKLVHRDLKPSNIFLSRNYEKLRIKVGDFGLARTCIQNDASGAQSVKLAHGIAGTAPYISPEMLQRRPYDHKTDIYSLAIIYYELLVTFKTAMERQRVLEEEIPNFDFPEAFVNNFRTEHQLILRMLSVEPAKRPNAGEISQELVAHRKKILQILKKTSDDKEDRWWEFCFVAIKIASGNGSNDGICKIGGKKPDIPPSVVCGQTKLLFKEAEAEEHDWESEARLGFVLFNVPWESINQSFALNELFLFDPVNISSEILANFFQTNMTISTIRIFLTLPNCLWFNINAIKSPLKQMFFRGLSVKWNSSNAIVSFPEMETLNLFDCDVDETIVLNAKTFFPIIKEVCYLNCHNSVSGDPLINALHLDKVYECQFLLDFSFNLSIMFGNCEAVKMQYSRLWRTNDFWDIRRIKPKDYEKKVFHAFCLDEIIPHSPPSSGSA